MPKWNELWKFSETWYIDKGGPLSQESSAKYKHKKQQEPAGLLYCIIVI